MRRLAAASLVSLALAWSDAAHAQDAQPAAPTTPAQIDLEADAKAPVVDPSEPPPEAPPAPPYKKSVVLDSSVGALAFFGKFGKTAPPGPWLHTQLGYEFLDWLMVFGEGDLAFTDTSGSQDPPKTRAFPVLGFGAGARFTIRFTPRFGIYAQGSFGALKADIAHNALAIIGFKDAEAFNLYAGARLGVEWYQIDRHFALGLNAGIRDAQGFAKVGSGDTPLVFDTGASLRYAF
jgi:hypothetical protein